MNTNWIKKHAVMLTWVVVVTGVGLTATLTYSKWIPQVESFMAFVQNKDIHADSADDNASLPVTSPDTLTLTPLAWRNIGLYVEPVQLSDYVQLVSVSAIVVERAGRSQTEITAPMTGIVTQVYGLEREIVAPGTPLFDLRLTHEDVVTAQSQFLAQLQSLDVANQELARLNAIVKGVIPGKRIVEQTYEVDKAKGALSASRQSLLLHGLSESQIANIESTRTVLKQITVVAPPFATNHVHDEDLHHQYHVQSVIVNRGESVDSGQLLGSLADHCSLYVEGMAFEDDARRLVEAASHGTPVKVSPVATQSGYATEKVSLELQVQSVADQIDKNSRALKFYLLLPNELIGDFSNDPDDSNGSELPNTPESGNSKHRFVAWKYRPGERMDVFIPTSNRYTNQIVLPAGAVAIEGPNAFVFEQNGDNFDRIDVHVLLRDRDTVVVENDGSLIGSILAMNGAYDMNLALKNQGGGAIDPHAGHTH